MQKTRVGTLDFQDIKDSIKNYLSQQTEFLDYNFEGSGINQLINVLAYNSHYDALAANFLANEVFLDTATKRSSIVSRAKELGYTPRSRRAATTTLSVTLQNIANEGSISSIILPRGARFSTTVNEETFTFTTRETVSLNKQIQLGQPIFTNTVNVYEGVLVQHTVTYDVVDKTLTIPNLDIDSTTLKVEVYESGQWVEYSQPQSFLSVTADSLVYMLQEGFNGFEIYFGDGTLGAQPSAGSQVRMTYVVTSGDVANGALNFTLSSAVTGTLSNTITTITSSAATSGGLVEESLDSIRLNAKNTFGSQNRAVTSKDYASLTLLNFPSVQSVLAWDGSENDPPKYGKVVLCVKPTVGDVLSTSEKTNISSFLRNKGVGNIKIDFVDPEYLNLVVNSTVKYDINLLSVSTYELNYVVKAAVTDYATSSIQKFSGLMRYSALLSAIDASDFSIVGNETRLSVNKQLRPNFFSSNNFLFTFTNEIEPGTVSSNIFYDGVASDGLFIKDNNGKLNVYYSLNGVDTLYTANIGTIDYVTGAVVISGLYIASMQELIFKISAELVNLDVSSSRNVILQLDQEDINVNIIKDVT